MSDPAAPAGAAPAPAGATTAREAAVELAGSMPDATRSATLTWQDPVPTAIRGLELSGLEYMRAVARKEIPPAPIAVLMNMAPIEIAEGRVVFSAEAGEEHYNPIGMVHGGFAATLLDSATGCAVHTTLEAGVPYASLGLEVKYLRAITSETGTVHCAAEVTYRGKRQATADARLTEAGTGRLLATGTSTCMILG